MQAVFIGIILAGIAIGVFYKWMRANTKSEISDAIKPLQDEINELKAQLRILQNGHQKASRYIMLGLDQLPQIEDNKLARATIHKAFDALSGIKADES